MTITYRWSALALTLMCSGAVFAQEKVAPLSRERMITVVSGSGAGSSIDTMVRTFTHIAARYTDQKFIIDNKTGGSGIVATNHVLKQPADGYTLFGLTRSYTINFHTQPDMPNPLMAYHYVGLTMESPVTIFTYKGSPYRDVKALIADGKAKPGEQSWGATFVGSVEWLITNSAQRHPAAKSVPTFRDLGYDVVEGNFRGFVTRQEIPHQAKDFYTQLYARVMADPRWQKFLDDTMPQRPPLGAAEMERLAKESSEKALPLMREAGLMKRAAK